MTNKLAGLSVHDLIASFIEIGIAQDNAELHGETKKFNRLYDRMVAIEDELKSRNDARAALLDLYAHPNMQVRLNAVKATLAIAPEKARQALQDIRVSRHYPQAMDAGMCLFTLDEGIFKPT